MRLETPHDDQPAQGGPTNAHAITGLLHHYTTEHEPDGILRMPSRIAAPQISCYAGPAVVGSCCE
jgi:hypothetical protein